MGGPGAQRSNPAVERAPTANSRDVHPPADGLSRPPASFKLLLEQATRASLSAMADGLRYLEIEFPPLPASRLSDATDAELSVANLRLALSFAAGLGKQVAVAVPDRAALAAALRVTGGRASPLANVRLHALTNSDGGAQYPETAIPFFGQLWRERKVRALQKKLRQAQTLQAEHAAGKELNEAQQAKVLAIASLQLELRALVEGRHVAATGFGGAAGGSLSKQPAPPQPHRPLSLIHI